VVFRKPLDNPTRIGTLQYIVGPTFNAEAIYDNRKLVDVLTGSVEVFDDSRVTESVYEAGIVDCDSVDSAALIMSPKTVRLLVGSPSNNHVRGAG